MRNESIGVRPLIVLATLLILFCLAAAACGDDDVSTPQTPVPVVKNIGTPISNDIRTYCWGSYRLFLSDVYYGESIAVVADPTCITEVTTP